MPLAASLVDRIHTRLLARYGAQWIRLWEGVDPAIVKADWAKALDGMSNQAIAYALDHLPEGNTPPNAGQFRAIARNRPQPDQLAIAGPAGHKDPTRWRAAFTRLAELRKSRGPLAWAYDLQEREARGEDLLPSQRNAWRAALESPAVPNQAELGQFTPIPDHLLPPAMRKGAGEEEPCR